MSDFPDHDSTDARAAELRRRQQEQLTRFFIVFAVTEGLVLAVCVIAIFVLELVDPELGIWVLLAVAALGAAVLSGYLLTTTRRNQRELDELTRR